MNVLTNEKTIRRNNKIGSYASMASLIIFGASIFISFQFQDKIFTKGYDTYTWLMVGGLFLGLILFQIGTYFMNRFGRKPRPDEAIEAALKGLGKEYTLYNYLTPVSHLLVGPAGVWVIQSYYQRGNISYKNGHWHQKGGGAMLAYMKIFGQEGLGRPDLEIQADKESISKLLKKELGDDAPPVNVALVFTDERAQLSTEDAPNPTLKPKELKEYLRKYAKEHPLAPADVKRITAILPDESIA